MPPPAPLARPRHRPPDGRRRPPRPPACGVEGHPRLSRQGCCRGTAVFPVSRGWSGGGGLLALNGRTADPRADLANRDSACLRRCRHCRHRRARCPPLAGIAQAWTTCPCQPVSHRATRVPWAYQHAHACRCGRTIAAHLVPPPAIACLDSILSTARQRGRPTARVPYRRKGPQASPAGYALDGNLPSSGAFAKGWREGHLLATPGRRSTVRPRASVACPAARHADRQHP